MRMHSCAGLLGLFSSVWLATSDARAFAPTPSGSNGQLEVLAPRLALLQKPVRYQNIPPSRAAAFQSFQADGAIGNWQFLWDSSTNVPRRMFGGTVAAPGTKSSAIDAEKHARMMLDRHADLLAPGCTASSFDLVSNVDNGGLRTVGFLQKYTLRSGERVPVLFSQVSFRYKSDRLFVLASEANPCGVLAEGRVSMEAARAAFNKFASQSGSSVVESAPELVVLPLSLSTGTRQAFLTYRAIVRISGIPFDVYLDAATASPLAKQSRARFAQGQISLDVPHRGPDGDRLTWAVRNGDLEVNGVESSTDASGYFTWDGTDPATVVPVLKSSTARVLSGSGEDAVASLEAADGANVLWSLADSETGDAQLSAFAHLSLVKERAREFASLSFLNNRMTAHVNGEDENFSCNAYWDGSSVNFFRENPTWGCSNTARVADVVYHEFGHGLHQYASILGAAMLDPALGEGQADYMAATTTGDSSIGPGFFLSGEALRELDPNRSWPADIDSDPHQTGLIFGGAMWDLRKAAIDAYGETEGVALADRLYLGAIRNGSDIPSTYAEILATDDDDGDLGNGTPHICVINDAFEAHGLTPGFDASGLTFTHAALSVVKAAGANKFVVTPTIPFPQCEVGTVESIRVKFQETGNATTEKTIELSLEGADYVGPVPALQDGSTYTYHVEVHAAGKLRSLPDNEADSEYQVYAGEVLPIYCNDFETSKDDWTFSSPTDFQWGSPHGLGGDPEEAFSGVKVLGQDLSSDGYYSSDRESYVESPAVDIGDAKNVRLQFRRWLNVEDGYYDQARISINGQEVWTNAGTSAGGTLHHADKEWRFVDLDVTEAIGGAATAQVRFSLESDEGYEFGGWNVDDVCLVKTAAAHTDEQEPETPTPESPSFDTPNDDDGNAEPSDSTRTAPALVASGGCSIDAGAASGAPALAASLALLIAALRRRPSKRSAG